MSLKRNDMEIVKINGKAKVEFRYSEDAPAIIRLPGCSLGEYLTIVSWLRESGYIIV